MNEQFEELAALHALDQLEGAERARFERALQDDPELRRRVAEYRTGAARLAERLAPPVAPPPQLKAAILGRIRKEGSARRVFAFPALLTRMAWPAAALLMLGINFYLLEQLREARAVGPTVAYGSATPALAAPAGPSTAAETEVADLRARIEFLQNDLAEVETLAMAWAGEGQTLQALLAEVDEERLALARSFAVLSERAAPLLGERPGYGRYTVVDLVDEEAFRSGERPGLSQIAGAILQTPGVAMLVRDGRSSGIAAGGAGTVNPVNPRESGDPLPTSNFLGSDLSDRRLPADGRETAFSDFAETPETLFEGRSYALSVFDEASGRGFMDLYNLPHASGGGEFHLWLRPAGPDAGYLPVGVLPADLRGQSGSVFFEVPAGTVTPVEFLITEESQPTPAAPSGPIVLRGP